MFKILKTCGHCRREAHLDFVWCSRLYGHAAKQVDRRPQALLGIRASHDESEMRAYATALCPFCEMPSVVTFKAPEHVVISIIEGLGKPAFLLGGEDMISVTGLFPTLPTVESLAHWPSEAAKLFTEAEAMLHRGNDPKIVIAVLRSVLELTLKDLGATKKNLVDMIDEVVKMGKLTTAVGAWAHKVRIDGNAAVHEAKGTHSDAEELLRFVRVFIDMTFVIPSQVPKQP